MKNALNDLSGLPRFTDINIEDIEPTIDEILQINRRELASLLEEINEIDWITFSREMEAMDNRLSRAWSPVSHLNSVMNSEALRKAHDACLPKLSSYSTELGQNTELYKAYKKFYEDESYTRLDQASKKVIENALLNFRLNGVALQEEEKQQFKEIKRELSSLKSKYEQNVLDATHAFKVHIDDKSQLQGLPEFARDMAAQAASEEDLKGWLFTLEAPSYISVMTYSDIRKFREEMYHAYTTRASSLGPNAGEYDNSQLMEDILKARKKMADLLGFKNYAELSIADKMAESTSDVISFLEDLVEKSRPQAVREFENLKHFAKKSCGIQKLEAWDVMYVSEKLKQKEYGISQEELKPYFPGPKVINGLFEIVNRLFGLSIEKIEGVNVWHKDVNFYEIKDASGEVRGQFYLDLYARQNKRGGAWMDECISRMICGDTIQTPVAYLTCNLTPPISDKPALLNHDEVTTLFHEFGHGLQHMLTRIDRSFVSGISGVEWDAVELPSQFMENWCWEQQGLELISSHHVTGEPLAEKIYKKLIKAKNFQSAMFMVRQLEFALFDFRLHMEYGSEKFTDIQTLLNEVRDKVSVVKPPEYNQFQHSFSHIFAGGYAAGYYSYKWAEVLSADAFSKFEESNVFDKKTGQEFMQCILETGGSEKAMDLFVKFRGREPEIDALLRHSGLLS